MPRFGLRELKVWSDVSTWCHNMMSTLNQRSMIEQGEFHHAQPRSASVVSWVGVEKMETIDRKRLIHCAKPPGFDCGRVCETVEEPGRGGPWVHF